MTTTPAYPPAAWMYTAAALAAHPTASQAVPLVRWTQAAAVQTSSHILSVDVYRSCACCASNRQPGGAAGPPDPGGRSSNKQPSPQRGCLPSSACRQPAAGQAAPLVRWTQAAAFSPAASSAMPTQQPHLLRPHSSLICYGHTAASSATATQQPHLLQPHSSLICYGHTAASSATATQQPHLLRPHSSLICYGHTATSRGTLLTWIQAEELDSLHHLGPFN
jgi:hypothetical protein